MVDIMTIKTFNSNWEIFKNGEYIISIPTDLDNINNEIYNSLEEVEADIIEKIGIELSEQEFQEIKDLVNIHFSSRF